MRRNLISNGAFDKALGSWTPAFGNQDDYLFSDLEDSDTGPELTRIEGPTDAEVVVVDGAAYVYQVHIMKMMLTSLQHNDLLRRSEHNKHLATNPG